MQIWNLRFSNLLFPLIPLLSDLYFGILNKRVLKAQQAKGLGPGSLGLCRVFSCTTITLSLNLKMCFVIWALGPVANWCCDNWSRWAFCPLDNEGGWREDGQGGHTKCSWSLMKGAMDIPTPWWKGASYRLVCAEPGGRCLFLLNDFPWWNKYLEFYIQCWRFNMLLCIYVYQGSAMRCEYNVTVLWKDNFVCCLAIK